MTAHSLIGFFIEARPDDIRKTFDELNSKSVAYIRTLAQRYGLPLSGRSSDSEELLNSVMSHLHGDDWLDKMEQ